MMYLLHFSCPYSVLFGNFVGGVKFKTYMYVLIFSTLLGVGGTHKTDQMTKSITAVDEHSSLVNNIISSDFESAERYDFETIEVKLDIYNYLI